MQTILENLQNVKIASSSLSSLEIDIRNNIISDIWDEIIKNTELIKLENQRDLKNMDKSDPMYDRLLLTDTRINAMWQWCYNLVNIKDPLKKYDVEKWIFTNDGLEIKKQAIPLWVVACIYEARPNVTIDIAIMAIKSSNWVVLRWWTFAKYSNIFLVKLIKSVLESHNINTDLIYNYPIEREKLDILYNAIWLVDVIIPRWWRKLIDNVRKKSLIPVIETWAWVVHLYLDDKIKEENFIKAIDIIINAKGSRPSVCNALDTLIINNNCSKVLLNSLFGELEKKWVKIINENIDYNKEQLSLNLNIKYVDNLEDAISHIQKYSSKHSDWILSDNEINIFKFIKNIDSSVVYTNTSTRFSDGSCFWFWWEIWISTQKLHSRWPMWSESLVSYKYVINSNWNIRI